MFQKIVYVLPHSLQISYYNLNYSILIQSTINIQLQSIQNKNAPDGGRWLTADEWRPIP